MNETKSNDRFFGNLALVLFVTGLLVPWIIALFNPEIAAGFGIVAELLALVFGIIGWKQKTGKVAAIGALVLVVVAMAAVGVYGFARSGPTEPARMPLLETRPAEGVGTLR